MALHIDVMRLPQPLVKYPAEGWTDAFLLTELDAARKGTVVKSYKLGGDHFFLVCRGRACESLEATRVQRRKPRADRQSTIRVTRMLATAHRRRTPVKDPRQEPPPAEPPRRKRDAPVDDPKPDETPIEPPGDGGPPVKEPPRRRGRESRET